MLKQRENVRVGGRLKKRVVVVALVVAFFLIFIKFGYSMVFTEKAFNPEKPPIKQSQKITFEKPPKLANLQNENIQKVSNVKNSTILPLSNMETFIDPDVDPRIIRKVEAKFIEQNSKPLVISKSGDHIQHVEDSDKYPLLYTNAADTIESPRRIVYLTFDDGPSPVTIDVLEVLKSRGVKATFFVVGNQVEMYPDILRQIVADGNAIGIHTNTHNYKEVYASVDSFLADYEECYKKIKLITDYPITVTRYPGGSNSNFNQGIRDQTREELKRRGFSYFDWNVSSGDSAPNGITSEQYVTNVLQGVKGKNIAVILTHDAMGRTVTADSIGKVIDELIKMGYQFGVLSNAIQPIQF